MRKTSEILTNLRSERGLSKTAAAKIAETSVNSYSSWEEGSIPKVGSGILLADYYGVTLDYLYGREERHIASQGQETTTDEAQLLKAYRLTDDRGRRDMDRLAMSIVLELTAKQNKQ